MLHVIGQTLTEALAIGISVLPLAGLIVILAAEGGRLKGALLWIGWFLAVAISVGIVAAIGNAVQSGSSDGSPTWVIIVQFVLGAILILLAYRQYSTRPLDGQAVREPPWMKAPDEISIGVALGLGAFLAVASAKNLVLILGSGVEIGAAGLGGVQTALTVLIFAFLAALLLLIPVLMAVLAPRITATGLDDFRAWLLVNGHVILSVILVLMAATMIGTGLSGLGS